jgi:hypothetical protein
MVLFPDPAGPSMAITTVYSYQKKSIKASLKLRVTALTFYDKMNPRNPMGGEKWNYPKKR